MSISESGSGCHVCGKRDVPLQQGVSSPFGMFKKVPLCDRCRQLGEKFERPFTSLGAVFLGSAVVSTLLSGFHVRAWGIGGIQWLLVALVAASGIAWGWVAFRFSRAVRRLKQRARAARD